MRVLIAMFTLLLIGPAAPQNYYTTQPICCTLPSVGTTSSTAITVSDSTVRDLVLQLRDGRLVLIRRVAQCDTVQPLLAATGDVTKAECFR